MIESLFSTFDVVYNSNRRSNKDESVPKLIQKRRQPRKTVSHRAVEPKHPFEKESTVRDLILESTRLILAGGIEMRVAWRAPATVSKSDVLRISALANVLLETARIVQFRQLGALAESYLLLSIRDDFFVGFLLEFLGKTII